MKFLNIDLICLTSLSYFSRFISGLKTPDAAISSETFFSKWDKTEIVVLRQIFWASVEELSDFMVSLWLSYCLYLDSSSDVYIGPLNLLKADYSGGFASDWSATAFSLVLEGWSNWEYVCGCDNSVSKFCVFEQKVIRSVSDLALYNR